MNEITRRDFINGTLMAAGAYMLPFGCTSDAVLAALEPSYYPPALTGLRGSQPGSNTHAHSRAWGGEIRLGANHQLERRVRSHCRWGRDQWVVRCIFLSERTWKRHEGADTRQS